MNSYASFALILAASAALGAVAVRLRQPLLVAFIIVGITAGPAGLNWVSSGHEIELLAQIGVTVLLFVVGLKLDYHVVRHIGPVALAAGLGQIVLTFGLGFLICAALGMSLVDAVYMAGALTFSSTIIIVKLLSDRREIDSLHGRIAVGVLIVQDVAVVAAMVVLGSLDAVAGGGLAGVALMLTLKLAAAAAVVFALMRYVLPPLMHRLARSQELLVLFALAWGTALSAFGDHIGFSQEAGAFLAGFALASTSYREAISARLTTLRDFLLLFFFINLGAKLQFSDVAAALALAIPLSLFVLIGKPLIVTALLGLMGYRRRTSFMTAISLAQVSEFSIVFLAVAIGIGHAAEAVLSVLTLVALVTITVSTYMVLYAQPLYARVSPWLARFERAQPTRELSVERGGHPRAQPDIIVFGAGRFGRRLIAELSARGLNVLAVDFDPENVRHLRRQHVSVRFGDAEDPELPGTLPLAGAAWVVSTLPEEDVNLALTHALKAHRYKGRIAVVVRGDDDTENFQRRGVAHVFRLYEDAADSAAKHIAQMALDEPSRQNA